jgi:hypothetical protein
MNSSYGKSKKRKYYLDPKHALVSTENFFPALHDHVAKYICLETLDRLEKYYCDRLIWFLR